jgi:hypothetical protein
MKFFPSFFFALGTVQSFNLVHEPRVTTTKLLSSLKEVDVEDRRSFLVVGLSTAATAALWHPSSAFADSNVDYKAVSKDIAALVKKDPNKVGFLLPLFDPLSLCTVFRD